MRVLRMMRGRGPLLGKFGDDLEESLRCLGLIPLAMLEHEERSSRQLEFHRNKRARAKRSLHDEF